MGDINDVFQKYQKGLGIMKEGEEFNIEDICRLRFIPPKEAILGAIKKDKNKPRMDLLPPKALVAIASIMTYGATKYANHNYKLGKGLDWNRPFAACLRHLNAWNDGEDNDKETGQSHLYHAGCCIMMLIDLVDSKIGKDTRFK